MSTEGRDRLIWHLSTAEGQSVRMIARQVGLSRSQVHRVLSAGPPPDGPVDFPDDDDDTDPDPWDADADPEAALSLYDPAEERWPVPPLLYVGTERQWFSMGKGNGGYWAELERWLDANGDRVGSDFESAEMALWRLANHYRHDLDDHEGAEALQRDWQAQRDAYDARARARRAVR
jgi:Helix-turn-helix domain of resolvase